MVRSLVYLAYHASERQWIESLHLLLRPQARAGLQVFDPFQILPGEKPFQKVQEALNHTRVAVVLVSKSLLADDVLFTDVIVPLVEARQRGDIKLLWLVGGPCQYDLSPLIAFAPARDPARPLSSLSPSQADMVLVRICEHIGASWNGSYVIKNNPAAKNLAIAVVEEEKESRSHRYARYVAFTYIARDVAIVVAILFWLVKNLLKQ